MHDQYTLTSHTRKCVNKTLLITLFPECEVTQPAVEDATAPCLEHQVEQIVRITFWGFGCAVLYGRHLRAVIGGPGYMVLTRPFMKRAILVPVWAIKSIGNGR